MTEPSDEAKRQRRLQSIKNALASSSLEGGQPSPELIADLMKYANGDAKIDDLIEQVKARYGILPPVQEPEYALSENATSSLDGLNMPLLLQLIRSGFLPLGQRLSCPDPLIAAVVSEGGIEIDGRKFSDPTDAMRLVMGAVAESDNGWVFWKVPDPVRGFTKPLEHVRIEWMARGEKIGVRTSETHPLRLDTLTLPGTPGRLGLTFLPGKKGDALYGAAWDRDLAVDVGAIRNWGAAAVVSVLEPHEFELLGVPEFPEVMASQPFQWFPLEIRDSDIPDSRFESAWPNARAELMAILRAGGGVVVHCRGGLGRTGLVVARLLVELGLDPEEAISQVRAVRPGAVETWEQEEYIRKLGRRHR